MARAFPMPGCPARHRAGTRHGTHSPTGPSPAHRDPHCAPKKLDDAHATQSRIGCSDPRLYPIRYDRSMDVATTVRRARERAGLTQAELARRAGTSQATISAYEGGSKTPAVATLARLLAATGSRLTVEPVPAPAAEPSLAELSRRARTLLDVLELAETLPARHEPELRFPRLRAA